MVNIRTLVISGINLFEGGPLSIYKDCLDNIIESNINETYNVIAFVHEQKIFSEYTDKITIIELPKSRKNYLYRLWYEYVYFYFYSKDKDIDAWLSLHDITPNVKASKRYVYCHNPSPFMKTELKNLKYSYKNFAFSILYKYLYKINIKKNTAVIVQQDWMRQEFSKMYKLENVIVAKPMVNISKMVNITSTGKKKYQFIFPSLPRFFKNFELICMACEMLEEKGVTGYEVLLTISGNENRYAKDIKNRFGKLKSVKFIGLQERKKLFGLYEKVDCMIFPSLLETWGLPISEFKELEKPILVADLPYAYETIGSYDKVCFFNPNKPEELACLLEKELNKTSEYTKAVEKVIKEPFAIGWSKLFEMIFY